MLEAKTIYRAWCISSRLLCLMLRYYLYISENDKNCFQRPPFLITISAYQWCRQSLFNTWHNYYTTSSFLSLSLSLSFCTSFLSSLCSVPLPPVCFSLSVLVGFLTLPDYLKGLTTRLLGYMSPPFHFLNSIMKK